MQKWKKVPKFEITEVVLSQYNVTNNHYWQTSRVLFTFVSDKVFGQLINISSNSLTILKTLNSKFISLRSGSMIKIASLLKKKKK